MQVEAAFKTKQLTGQEQTVHSVRRMKLLFLIRRDNFHFWSPSYLGDRLSCCCVMKGRNLGLGNVYREVGPLSAFFLQREGSIAIAQNQKIGSSHLKFCYFRILETWCFRKESIYLEQIIKKGIYRKRNVRDTVCACTSWMQVCKGLQMQNI